MTPKAIVSALTAAQVLFLPIDGQPSKQRQCHCVHYLKSTYNCVNSVHNLWGLVANGNSYLHHYSAPFVCPATRLACYDPAINVEASHVDHYCAEAPWATKIQDYKAYEANEHGVKVCIKAVVEDTWICDLRNPQTFYSNVTALTLFNHLREHSRGLHALDIVLLTSQMS
jgi:hypothetical protein